MMKKRLFSTVLALLIMFTISPVSAYAAVGTAAIDILADDQNAPPIIIIPGIMGSELYSNQSTFNNSTRVWSPPITITSILTLGRTLKNNTLYVRPAEDQHSASAREYGTLDTYKALVDRLCEEFPDRAIYFYSYDWRKDNSILADELKTFIDSLGADVDLLCHSMGGLVAAKYYAENLSSHKINKILTAGTPYEGAPQVLNSVQNLSLPENGSMWLVQNLASLFGGLNEDVKTSFLSVAELLPTENYISKVKMWQDSWKPFNLGDYQLTYQEYADYCNRIFGENTYATAKSFQNSLLDSDNYNMLLQFPDAYFSIGTNQPTITAVKFQYFSDNLDQLMYENDLNYSMKGDGTVPYVSATITEQIAGISADRYRTFATDHSGLIGQQGLNRTVNRGANDSLNWIVGILGDRPVPMPRAAIASIDSYIVVRAEGAADIIIAMDDEILDSGAAELSSAASFGRMDILGQDNAVKMFCISDADDYDIMIAGNGSGEMNYSIRLFDGDGVLLDERVIADVPVTETTRITTSSDFSAPITLAVDADNDGVVDNTLTAEPFAEEPEGITLSAEASDYRITATLSGNISGDAAAEQEVQLIAAIYGPEGKLKAMKTITRSFNGNETVTAVFDLDTAAYPECTYKVLALDSNFAPLCAAVDGGL